MASVKVSRDFLRIGERQVHFRYAGSGAPVILLHQSPRSSAELVPLLQFLAPHCLVIAPDAPGFGLSDPLKPSDAAPSIDDFCDALAGMLEQLGFAQASIFGSHTGAIIAVRFASRYASRVTAVIANGILLTTAEERTDKAEHYLPRFVPSWDGSHLAWLWSRLRDQLIFYPWYRRDPVNRICWPQSLQDIEDGALDLLQSGDNYRGAYGAVLDYAIAEDLPHLRVPTLLLVARTDALSRFVEHYPPLPACVKVEVVADFPDIPAATLAWLTAHTAPAVSLPRKGAVPSHGYSSSFVDLGDGSIHLRTQIAANAPAVLALHDLGASAAALSSMLGGSVGEHSLYIADLPGNGDSDALNAITPPQIAAVLLRLADALALPRFDLIAFGASAAIALALRALAPQRVHRMVIAEPLIAPSERAAEFIQTCVPDLRADISGSHLLRAWYFLRDRALFYPWYDRSATAQSPLQRPPRPNELQQSLIDLLKARPVFAAQLRAALSAGTAAALSEAGCTLLATEGCAARRSGLTFARLPDEKFQWAAPLLRALPVQTVNSG